MFVEQTGGITPAVIFMHGVTANYAVWNEVLDALPMSWSRLAIDQRGHGRSSRDPGDGYAARDYAADVAALRRTIDKTVPVFLVGHSLGARNAIAAAAENADLFAGIVAIDFCPFIETPVFDRLEDRVLGGDRTFDSVRDVEAYIHDRYPLMPSSAVERRAEFGYALSSDVYRALADPKAMRHTVQGLRADLSAEVSALKIPTVMVRGELSTLVSADAFEKTRALRPDLDYVVVADADHYVPEEQPVAVAAIITSLVTRVLPTHQNEPRDKSHD